MLRPALASTSRHIVGGSPLRAIRPAARGLRSLADLASSIEGQSNKAAKQIKAAASSPLKESVPERIKSTSLASTRRSSQPFKQSLVLTLSCPDTRGIVHRVTGWLASRHFDIRDSAQYGDPDTAKFFMRVHASGPDGRTVDMNALVDEFKRDVGEEMQMRFEIVDEDVKPKTMLMVSKIGRK